MQWEPTHYQQTHDFSALPFRYRELCQVIKITPSLAGRVIRLKLTNRYGKTSLTFARVVVADNPDFKSGELVKIDHNENITIPQGKVVFTDPLNFTIAVNQPIYIKMVANQPQAYADFAATYQTTLTNAALSRQHDFQPPFSERWQSRKGWFSLESVEVATNKQPLQVEITGDSLVESGMVSATLIRYFNQVAPNQISWYQTGISGNQLLHDAPVGEPLYETFGQACLSRYQTSLLAPQLTLAIIGTNDLILPFYSRKTAGQNVTTRELMHGFQHLHDLCHVKGSQFMTTTIAPIRLFDLANPLPAEQLIEQQRCDINRWLRHQSWVVDGAQRLTDPSTAFLDQRDDFGDHLHWSPTGGKRVAELLIPRIDKLL